MNTFMRRVLCGLITATFLLSIPTISTSAQPARSQRTPPEPPPFTPLVTPTLHIRPTAGSISIDGHLDDPGWQSAARTGHFTEVQPDEQAEPPIPISAWMSYDETTLYVAFRITEDPATIRANFSDRDNIWNDDYVGLLLDTQGDGHAMVFLAANPLGIQGDTRITYNNEDVGFDLIWDAAGRITDEGYEVEMAIPFRSLRFPRAEVQQWRISFWITHPRDSRAQYSWAAINRDIACWPCQFGYLEGIEGVVSGRNIELLPTLVGGQSAGLRDSEDAASGFDQERIRLEPSLDLKYGLTSDLTAELTLNPDFSQIESDAAQIDVNSTFALFFPERRPFFQEGADLFETRLQTMYTRSINNPILAGKFTGRVGQTDVAYLTARDVDTPLLLPFEERSELVESGRSFSNIARVRHAFPGNNALGVLLTDRRLDDGGSGTTAGIDGMLRFAETFVFTGQVVGSRTIEPVDPEAGADFEEAVFDGGTHTTALDGETFNGHALYGNLNRNARHWNFNVGYEELSPTFRADNGFITQNDHRQLRLWNGINIYPRQIGFIDRIMPQFGGRRQWNFAGERKRDAVFTEVFAQMKSQTNLFAGVTLSRERFEDQDFNDLHTVTVGVFSNFSEWLGFDVFASTGRDINRNADTPEDLVTGRSLGLNGGLVMRPTARLRIAPALSYAALRHPDRDENFFSGYILRTRLNYQFTSRLLVRTIVQYNDFSEALEIDPLLTYRINPFTVFYVGSTHDFGTFEQPNLRDGSVFRQRERQVFFKFQYLVRA